MTSNWTFKRFLSTVLKNPKFTSPPPQLFFCPDFFLFTVSRDFSIALEAQIFSGNPGNLDNFPRF